ncbi:MAG: FkbM family methyltransferase [Patescibacteria group bacterium]
MKRSFAAAREAYGLPQKLKAFFLLPLISIYSPITIGMQKWDKGYIANFNTGSDIAMWAEVFSDEEYRLPKDFFPKKIIDLGANAGFASLYFALRDPEAQVASIEPDPHNFELLKKNVSHNSKIIPIPAAVAAESGEREFFSAPRQGMASSFQKRGAARCIKVSALSFNDILKKLEWQGADLVKFDIEGAEWEVFKDFPFAKVGSFIGEYHEDLVGRPLQDFLDLFAGFKSECRLVASRRYIVYLYPTK